MLIIVNNMFYLFCLQVEPDLSACLNKSYPNHLCDINNRQQQPPAMFKLMFGGCMT